MATLGTDLIEETLRLLHTGSREAQNKLSAAISNVSTTAVSLTYALDGIQAGTALCVDTELLYVWEVNTSTKTATVQRGWRGSVAATHLTDSLVQVNPRFSRFDILHELNHDLDDLSANGLYRVRTVDLTFNASVQGYDLTGVTDLIDVIEVKYATPGPTHDYPVISPSKWRLERNAPTGTFPSSFALQLYEGGHPGLNVRVSYKAPFALMTAETQDAQTDVGLPSTANDLPPLGAAIRLTTPREVKRNFTETQGDTRRPDEVPAGANINAARGYATWRRERIEQEKARQHRQYPVYLAVR